MRRSAENVVRFYDKTLSPSGITARQYSLLNAIAEHSGCSIKKLSDVTLLDRSTLARSLKPLFNSGYIRDAKEEGKRDSILELTKKGNNVRKEASQLWQVAQDTFEKELSPEKVATLESILVLLQNL